MSPASLFSSSTFLIFSLLPPPPTRAHSPTPTHPADLPIHSANKPIRRSKLWVSFVDPSSGFHHWSRHCLPPPIALIFRRSKLWFFFFFFLHCIALHEFDCCGVGLVDFFLCYGLWWWWWLWLMFIVEYILFYCSGYIILLWCLYYFIVLKAKIDPLL